MLYVVWGFRVNVSGIRMWFFDYVVCSDELYGYMYVVCYLSF